MAQAALHSGPSGRGRPRSERSQQAVLESAYGLVAERGYANVTTADIAAHAGAGKQTIYRWWPSKAGLVLNALAVRMDAMAASGRKRPPTTLPAFLAELCRGATHTGPVLRSLIAESQHDDELREQLKAQILEPRRNELRASLPHLRPVERELVIGAIYGAVMYRLLLDEPLDAAFVRGVIRMLGRLR